MFQNSKSINRGYLSSTYLKNVAKSVANITSQCVVISIPGQAKWSYLKTTWALVDAQQSSVKADWLTFGSCIIVNVRFLKELSISYENGTLPLCSYVEGLENLFTNILKLYVAIWQGWFWALCPFNMDQYWSNRPSSYIKIQYSSFPTWCLWAVKHEWIAFNLVHSIETRVFDNFTCMFDSWLACSRILWFLTNSLACGKVCIANMLRALNTLWVYSQIFCVHYSNSSKYLMGLVINYDFWTVWKEYDFFHTLWANIYVWK